MTSVCGSKFARQPRPISFKRLRMGQMDMRHALYRLYKKGQEIIFPGLQYSQNIYEEFLDIHVQPGVDWLDLGCGHMILPPWREENEKVLINRCRIMAGIDRDLESIACHRSISHRICADVSELPFKSRCFDLVTANMVVEHLENPIEQFKEVNRVLRPEGVFLFHTPNAMGYARLMGCLVPDDIKKIVIPFLEGRKESDIYRTYYRANREKTIGLVAAASGFQVQRIRFILSHAQFKMILPVALVELVWLRLLKFNFLRMWRGNIIAILRKKT